VKLAKFSKAKHFLLAITLVLAQCLLLVHDTGAAKHDANHVCNFCLQASGVGSPHVAPSIAIPPALDIQSFPTTLTQNSVVTSLYQSAQARAPPVLS